MKRINTNIYKIVLIVFSVICFVLNLTQCFSNNLWCDEIASVMYAEKSCMGLISGTALDVHPPLYYLILKLFCTIFGFSGTVYHVVSTIPFALVVIFSLTIVWKELGEITATILVVCESLLYCSMYFNVEVRMYSWASLFILLSYWYFRKLLLDANIKNYTLFSLFSLFAAYTHYFCILTVIPFYVVILFMGIKEKGKRVKLFVLSWGMTIGLYLPWAISFFVHYTDTKEKIYSAGYTNVWVCVKFIFDTKFWWVLLSMFVLLTIWTIVRNSVQYEKIWIISGIAGIALTILIPYIISVVMSPIMEKRHVYPSFVIAWLLLGYSISKQKYKVPLLCITLVLVIPTGFLTIYRANVNEKKCVVALDDFLGKTSGLIDNSGTLISSDWQIAYPLYQYYYDKDDSMLFLETDEEILDYMNKSIDNEFLIFFEREITESFIDELESENSKVELITENQHFGAHRVWVLKYQRDLGNKTI